MPSSLLPSSHSGLFLVFEGLDGAGKTTQCQLLAAWLQQQGWDVVTTREPTYGPWGQKIRTMAQSGEEVPIETELDWFVQDRKEHIRELIAPSLTTGKAVVQDRYYFSSIAYQGSRGADPQAILEEHVTFCPEPDAVFFLDIPAEQGLQRVQESRGDVPDAFERLDVLQRCATLFRGFTFPFFHRLDGTLSPDDIHQQIRTIVSTLQANKRS